MFSLPGKPTDRLVDVAICEEEGWAGDLAFRRMRREVEDEGSSAGATMGTGSHRNCGAGDFLPHRRAEPVAVAARDPLALSGTEPVAAPRGSAPRHRWVVPLPTALASPAALDSCYNDDCSSSGRGGNHRPGDCPGARGDALSGLFAGDGGLPLPVLRAAPGSPGGPM